MGNPIKYNNTAESDLEPLLGRLLMAQRLTVGLCWREDRLLQRSAQPCACEVFKGMCNMLDPSVIILSGLLQRVRQVLARHLKLI